MNEPLFKEGATVFDVGAHYGESINKFRRASAGKIISLEPCLENYLELLKNYNPNDGLPKSDVVPILAAAWHSTGFAQISRAESETGLTTLLREKWEKIYPDAKYSEPRTVATVTLDMLAVQFGKPQHVKVDVEGSELSVLLGMTRFQSDSISFEFHHKYEDDALACLALLQNRGYRFGSFVREDAELIKPTEPISLMIYRFIEEKPEWGNITLTL